MKLRLNAPWGEFTWTPDLVLHHEGRSYNSWDLPDGGYKIISMEYDTDEELAFSMWNDIVPELKEVTPGDLDKLYDLLYCEEELLLYIKYIKGLENLDTTIYEFARYVDNYGVITPDEALQIQLKLEHEPDCGWVTFEHGGKQYAFRE